MTGSTRDRLALPAWTKPGAMRRFFDANGYHDPDYVLVRVTRGKGRRRLYDLAVMLAGDDVVAGGLEGGYAIVRRGCLRRLIDGFGRHSQRLDLRRLPSGSHDEEPVSGLDIETIVDRFVARYRKYYDVSDEQRDTALFLVKEHGVGVLERLTLGGPPGLTDCADVLAWRRRMRTEYGRRRRSR